MNHQDCNVKPMVNIFPAVDHHCRLACTNCMITLLLG